MSKIKFKNIEFTELQYDELRDAVANKALSLKDDLYKNFNKGDGPELKKEAGEIKGKIEALEKVKKELSEPSSVEEKVEVLEAKNA